MDDLFEDQVRDTVLFEDCIGNGKAITPTKNRFENDDGLEIEKEIKA
ncbi:hypothetical protein ACT6NV_12160 [Robiginitalea sp. IMCC44478]